ncbi:FAD-dependent oxidoreductase [Amycolatopsis pigmentata]|uniref:FAD-dependent oxidoreductase n=1 Tax=Amycolatopsis pigmentata TaxID=450801 RepID=A0ABW5FQU0_9PSEU
MARAAGKRVAIIGAGPGGLTAALGLSRVGHDVTVFERWPEVKSVGAGIALWPPPLKALEILGIDIESLGSPAVPVFTRPDGRVIGAYPTKVDKTIDTPLWLGAMRSALYDELHRALPPGLIRSGKRCVSVSQDDSSATAHFEDGTAFEADLIIGADGLRSVVRKYLEGDRPIRDNHLTVWLGHTFESFPDRAMARMSLDPRGYQCGYTPMEYYGQKGWHWWVMERRDSTSPMPEPQAIKERVMTIAEGVADPVPEMIKSTPLEHFVPWVIRDRDALPSWVNGRIAVMGDAAHATNPYAGYGAGMAIVDGFYLACTLAGVDLSDRAALSPVLARYEADRKPETDAVVAFAYMMGQLMHTTNPVKRFVRDLLLDHTPFLRKQLAKQYGDALTSAFAMVVELGKRMPPAQGKKRSR